MRLINSALWQLGRLYLSRKRASNVITVIEYPKGGGTWIGKLLAVSLDVPFVGGGPYLPLIPCVIRTHWPASASISPCVVVVRDPRDVMVSLFHHRLRNMSRTPIRKKQFDALFKEGLSEEKIVEQLPDFIRLEFEDPRYGSRVNWSKFVDQALNVVNSSNEQGNTVVLVKYEDLLSDPNAALGELLKKLKFDVAEQLVAYAIKINDKSWGNKKFIKNPNESTFVRSGVTGEWRQVMSEESCKIMAELCGDKLISLGYEESLEWWRNPK